MKLWLKFLIGIIVGLILGAYLPVNSSSLDVLQFLQNLIVNIGMYSVFPLVFFSLGIALMELQKDGRLVRLCVRIVLYMLAATFIFTILGILSVLLFSPERMLIGREQPVPFEVISLRDFFFSTIPVNSFSVFSTKGFFLLPVYVLAFILGLNLSFDKVVTRPVVQLFDSFARIFFNINKYVVQFLSFGMVVITAFFLFQIRGTEEIVYFQELALLFTVNAVLVVFGLLPLLLYLLGERQNPYKLLLGSIPTLMMAFMSGNGFTTLPIIIRNGKNNLGIPRKVGAVSYPLLALFGKAGTAMITSISFIVIVRSYTSLGLTFGSILWIGVFSILLSFVTAAMPAGSGVFLAIAVICRLYGAEIENGYLILKPALPLLVSFSAFMDATVMIFVSALASTHENYLDSVEIRDMV
ncbi:MAG: dicarboxylate/amino acid:cation symporter [Spirochaetales bacterium]|nr:dicarboxylate/amino acid:cation symporter [Spirochaetales bacterium]